MKLLPDGRIQYRVRIRGTYKGVPFEYIDPESDSGWGFCGPDRTLESDFWWREGNMSCDCNRVQFMGATCQTHPELFNEDGSVKCGEQICIDTIDPVEDGLPAIALNESSGRICS